MGNTDQGQTGAMFLVPTKLARKSILGLEVSFGQKVKRAGSEDEEGDTAVFMESPMQAVAAGAPKYVCVGVVPSSLASIKSKGGGKSERLTATLTSNPLGEEGTVEARKGGATSMLTRGVGVTGTANSADTLNGGHHNPMRLAQVKVTQGWARATEAGTRRRSALLDGVNPVSAKGGKRGSSLTGKKKLKKAFAPSLPSTSRQGQGRQRQLGAARKGRGHTRGRNPGGAMAAGPLRLARERRRQSMQQQGQPDGSTFIGGLSPLEYGSQREMFTNTMMATRRQNKSS